MARGLIVCASDFGHAPAAREVLEADHEVRYLQEEADVLAALPEAVGYLASLTVRMTDEVLAGAGKLRAISTPSTGLDHIDLDAAAARGVEVLSLKYDREFLDNITSTAELAWLLVLACARRLVPATEASRRGFWGRDAFRGHQLSGLTFGILGCGRLGTIVSQYARAFRMRVLGCDTADVKVEGVEMVSLDELLAQSDVLSIHIHLTEENKGLIDAAVLAKMKKGAMLVNTSRGAIIDEDALLAALESGHLAAAGLDVIHGEWRDDLAEHPLIRYAREHDNLTITPHVGGVCYESQAMAFEQASRKLVAFLDA